MQKFATGQSVIIAICYHFPVPRFDPFIGLRYDLERHDLDLVTAPPYDVIDAADRADLAARSSHNAVLVDLPDEADGEDRYRQAARRLIEWEQTGDLVADERPSFTVYRMGYLDDLGRPAHTLGVVGALRLSRPGEGGILPHEQTTLKAKTDRLDLLRATGANLSAVWGLSLTTGLTRLLELGDQPLQAWTDANGVDHAVWRVDDHDRVRAIARAVAASPVVIADGHHRYETSLAYRDERRAADAGGDGGGAEATMCFVVELVPEQLTVRPIHRLLSGLPDGYDLVGALAPWFTAGDTVAADGDVLHRMDEAGSLAVVTPDGTARLLRPRSDALAAAADLDSSRLAVALEALGSPAEVVYQHGVDRIVDAVRNGHAQRGVLLRAATVDQIAANARSGERMPAKTTFFHPKPKTGLVFRRT